MKRVVGMLTASGLVALVGAACGPIVGTPLSDAPVNTCTENPCDRYAGAKNSAACKGGRCELGVANLPSSYVVVVSVPNTSFYAPSRSFVFTNVEINTPRFPPVPGCPTPTCLPLPSLGSAAGAYFTQAAAAKTVGLPVVEKSSIPVRVTYVPQFAASNLPVDLAFTASRIFQEPSQGGTKQSVLYTLPLPAGRYTRILYPEPPFDAYFPPFIGDVRIDSGFTAQDNLTLGDTVALDDPDDVGDSRLAIVTRPEGLDGWQIHLERDGRRISSLRTLAGNNARVRLDTAGQATLDDVDVILAPPADWIGVPRLESGLLGGQGLKSVQYPSLPAPGTLIGRIAIDVASVATGIAGRVIFESTAIRLPDGTKSQLLRYTTTVSTDEAGRFQTVLPLGVYDVTLEPAEGTGFGKVKRPYEIDESLHVTFVPPRRTHATGHVVLGDGRPLGRALIVASPSSEAGPPSSRPRPAQTTSAPDGSFSFDIDAGQYDLTVVPQAGTGFPRVVTPGRSIAPAKDEDLGTTTVPLPAPLSFDVKDPSRNGIAGAMVRVFLPREGGLPVVEIGSALTDGSGHCEILLAPSAR